MVRQVLIVLMFLGILIGGCAVVPSPPATPWTSAEANAWYAEQPWLVGCNFIPSTAINPLEMWQAETFDPETINRELGWAEQIGFNTIRVYLNHLLWQQHPRGFLHRLDTFLDIADKHNIRVMFVLLDAVWDPFPRLGEQPEPTPYVHNSGWVQSPGVKILRDPERHDELKGYIKGVIWHFNKDRRILAWDLFNEPDNMNRPAYVVHEPENKAELSLMLLKKVFAWARAAKPTQPLTVGVWQGDWSESGLSAIDRYMLENSDVISFHSYADLATTKARVETLKRYGRPLLCTEYMARPAGSTFATILPYFKQEHVAAYNWGFVAGKTQTIYPWDSWSKSYTAEPKVWFHDIFRPNGTPYDPEEIRLIRQLTGRGR